MIRSLLAFFALITACSPAPSITERTPTAPAVALTCFRESGFSMLAAHRGGPAPGFPENSISGLRRLAEMGVLYAEIDVRRSDDGQLYLLHDDTLDRTTTGSGPVAGQTWSDLSGLSLVDNEGQPANETLPTLEDAIDLARSTGLVLNLDLKSVSPAELIDIIHARDARDHVAIIAYSIDAAVAIHALDPGLVLSVPNDPAGLTAAGVNLDAVYVWLGTGNLDAEADARLATRGLESSAGLFRREDGSPAPYLEAHTAGIELLSIDNVDAAVSALGGAPELHRQIAACEP